MKKVINFFRIIFILIFIGTWCAAVVYVLMNETNQAIQLKELIEKCVLYFGVTLLIYLVGRTQLRAFFEACGVKFWMTTTYIRKADGAKKSRKVRWFGGNSLDVMDKRSAANMGWILIAPICDFIVRSLGFCHYQMAVVCDDAKSKGKSIFGEVNENAKAVSHASTKPSYFSLFFLVICWLGFAGGCFYMEAQGYQVKALVDTFLFLIGLPFMIFVTAVANYRKIMEKLCFDYHIDLVYTRRCDGKTLTFSVRWFVDTMLDTLEKRGATNAGMKCFNNSSDYELKKVGKRRWAMVVEVDDLVPFKKGSTSAFGSVQESSTPKIDQIESTS